MNVKFYSVKLKSTFDALETKDNLALYWIIETSELYKGDQLFGTGAIATHAAAGLLSTEDKAKLDALVAASGTLNLTAVDGSINLIDVAGGKAIGVAISEQAGNLVAVKDDGIFVAIDSLPIDKIIGLEDRLDTVEQSAVGGVRYKGSVETVDELPSDAVQGDMYEVLTDNSEWCFNGDKWFEYGHTVDFSPVTGDGIAVDGRKISVNIAKESNGLVAVDGALMMNLATDINNGAMSSVDKVALDNLVALDIANKFATKEEFKSVEDAMLAIPTPNAEQFIVENGVFTLKDIAADKIMYNGKKLSDIISEQENSYTWEDLGSETFIDLASDDAVSIIGNAEDNSVVALNSGSVTSALNVASSVTIEGVNAGMAQNFDQEV